MVSSKRKRQSKIISDVGACDECQTFDVLAPALRHDLTLWHGFPNPDAGGLLNWFNPRNPEYLQRVDAWQVSLCRGVEIIPPPHFLPYYANAYGTYDLFHASNDQVAAVHQVAKLVYKWHGIPRKETDMNEVKTRLREPLPITLGSYEIEGIRRCLSGIKPPSLYEVIGRFGPGCTSEGFTSYEKWTRQGLCPPVPPNLFRVNSRDPWSPSGFAEGVTKIAEVPKNIKCNRIVSSEPAMYQFAQLAVGQNIVDQLHRLFPNSVSLDDQDRHNEALEWDNACSIDLSDASDHNSLELVNLVLPQLTPVLASVRSSSARFPDGEEVPLGTFAPMGSGLCFPVMTTVLVGIISFAICCYKADGGHKRCWFRVYGDDIIVPIWLYDHVMDLISRSGFLPNHNKSCCTLLYRESCGKELYRGRNISPASIRDPLQSLDAASVEEICGRLDRGFFPKTAEMVAKLSGCIRFQRYNPDMQRREVCVRTSAARQKLRQLDGWSGLNRWFSIHTQGNTWYKSGQSGVASEVWTKTAWRFRDEAEYPYLTRWLVTNGVCQADHPPEKQP